MSQQRYRPDHKAALDALLLGVPGVEAGQMFGHPSYKVGGKIFASLMEDGVTIKLPEDTVNTLLARDNMEPFAPMGNAMRQWVLIHVADTAEYAQYTGLFEQAVEFVLASATG